MKTPLKTLLLATLIVALPAALSAASAEENWTKQCAKCHGADGSASGPMGKKLKLKNYKDAAVNAAMSDEEIIQAIKAGVKDEASGKMVMPAYGDKLSDEEVKDLLALVRSMAA